MESQNIESVEILNIDKEESTVSEMELVADISNINSSSFIVSDADQELLVLISFKKEMNLKGIKVHSLGLSQEDNDIVESIISELNTDEKQNEESNAAKQKMMQERMMQEQMKNRLAHLISY